MDEQLLFERLKNRGVACLNRPAVLPDERTIVVVGVARGATSAVAGVLHHLGVFMGERSHPPVFEDVLLSTAFESFRRKQFRTIVERYNREHAVWGWKRPDILHDLPRVEKSLRNPIFVVVFRDLLAIALRNTISMDLDLCHGLRLAWDHYGKIITFLTSTKASLMLVSSEKLIQNKAMFIERLCDFVQISPGDAQRQAALQFIRPDRIDYLDQARVNKVRGHVRLARGGKLRGWACGHRAEEPVTVIVSTADRVLAKLKADLLREDVRAYGHPTGLCGFELDLTAFALQPGTEIHVRGERDITDLTNSPLVWKAD